MRKVLYILGLLNDSDVEWLSSNGVKQRIKAGQTLIQAGHSVDSVYILLDGEVSIISERQGEREIDVSGAGEIIGEMSLIEARPPVVSVRVKKDAVVLAISRARIDAHLKQDIGFASRFYHALAVFLSHRLRGSTVKADVRSGPVTPQEEDEEDELDANLMDSVHLAGMRFNRLLKTLMEN